MNDRRELRLSEEIDDLVEAHTVTHLDLLRFEERGIGIDTHDRFLHGPVRACVPVPAGQAGWPGLLADRRVVLKKCAGLVPALPVTSHIHRAIGLVLPSYRRFFRARIVLRHGSRVEAVKQERFHVGPLRIESRLKDNVRYGGNSVLPFPALMAVELFQMIEVVVDSEGVVVAAP